MSFFVIWEALLDQSGAARRPGPVLLESCQSDCVATGDLTLPENGCFAIRGHHRERLDPPAHAAVPHRPGSRGISGAHAAEGRPAAARGSGGDRSSSGAAALFSSASVT